MDLSFTDEQEFLRDAVRGVVEREAPPARVRDWVLGEDRQLQHSAPLAAGLLRDADPGPALADGEGVRCGVVHALAEHPVAHARQRRLPFDDATHGVAQELLLVGEGQVHRRN